MTGQEEQKGSSRTGTYVILSVTIAASSLFYIFVQDLAALWKKIAAWTGTFSVALPVLVFTIGACLMPGALLVVLAEVEDILRKWLDFPEEPENYVRLAARKVGRVFDRLLRSPTVGTAAVLFVVILVEAEFLAGGASSQFEHIFLLDSDWPTKPWTLVTSGLAHRDLVHYGANVAVLLLVGPLLEDHLSWVWWVTVFLVANAVGGVVQVALSAPGTSVLGSSPALLAFTSIFLLEVPRSWEISELDWETGLWVFAGSMSVLFVLAWLAVLTQTGEPGIGHWAHLVGALVGVGAVGLRWRTGQIPADD